MNRTETHQIFNSSHANGIGMELIPTPQLPDEFLTLGEEHFDYTALYIVFIVFSSLFACLGVFEVVYSCCSSCYCVGRHVAEVGNHSKIRRRQKGVERREVKEKGEVEIIIV